MADPEKPLWPRRCFRWKWEKRWRPDCIFDLWEVRNCFAATFARNNYFITRNDNDKIEGILPLSWLEQNKLYFYELDERQVHKISFDTANGKIAEQEAFPLRDYGCLIVWEQSLPAFGRITCRYCRKSDDAGGICY